MFGFYTHLYTALGLWFCINVSCLYTFYHFNSGKPNRTRSTSLMVMTSFNHYRWLKILTNLNWDIQGQSRLHNWECMLGGGDTRKVTGRFQKKGEMVDSANGNQYKQIGGGLLGAASSPSWRNQSGQQVRGWSHCQGVGIALLGDIYPYIKGATQYSFGAGKLGITQMLAFSHRKLPVTIVMEWENKKAMLGEGVALIYNSMCSVGTTGWNIAIPLSHLAMFGGAELQWAPPEVG